VGGQDCSSGVNAGAVCSGQSNKKILSLQGATAHPGSGTECGATEDRGDVVDEGEMKNEESGEANFFSKKVEGSLSMASIHLLHITPLKTSLSPE
jgi:hypothetical protein